MTNKEDDQFIGDNNRISRCEYEKLSKLGIAKKEYIYGTMPFVKYFNDSGTCRNCGVSACKLEINNNPDFHKVYWCYRCNIVAVREEDKYNEN